VLPAPTTPSGVTPPYTLILLKEGVHSRHRQLSRHFCSSFAVGPSITANPCGSQPHY
jgi:hypothetical protein